MANETKDSLQTLNLSAKQIKQGTNWPDFMIDDYLTNFRNSQIISITTDSNIILIEQNTADIQVNTDNIQANTDNLSTHTTSNSQHGVTGDNVGTEDFAQNSTGGVVLLMSLVNNASTSGQVVTLADIASAPSSYNQAYVQTIADMANDIKNKHNNFVAEFNDAVTQFNLLLARSKSAKQMSSI